MFQMAHFFLSSYVNRFALLRASSHGIDPDNVKGQTNVF
jgi:hypothetical protein